MEKDGIVINTGFDIYTDLVESDVPLLISISEMSRLKCSMNFRNIRLELENGRFAQLKLNQRGHLAARITKTDAHPSEDTSLILTLQGNGGGNINGIIPTRDEIRRLHIHLARDSVGVLRRIFQKADRKAIEEDLGAVVGNCACSDSVQKVQRPLISKMDTRIPWRHSFPRLLPDLEDRRIGENFAINGMRIIEISGGSPVG